MQHVFGQWGDILSWRRRPSSVGSTAHHRKRLGLHGLLGWLGSPRLDVGGLEGWLVGVEGHALVGQRSPNLGRSASVIHFHLLMYLIFQQLYHNDLLVFLH